MALDPHALKLYIDGSCQMHDERQGGRACIVEYPLDWNLPNEAVFELGFFKTTNNRMELDALLAALRYVRDNPSQFGVQRIQIVTDSMYVYENFKRAAAWRRNGWKNFAERPIENRDLWKEFLKLQSSLSIRVDIVWQKGKTTPVLKDVDRAAKRVSREPTRHDRGYRTGKIGKSKLGSHVAVTLFPADGQDCVIRIYRSELIGKRDHLFSFDLWSAEKAEYVSKHQAYAATGIAAQLHRGHNYRVRFNSEPQYPLILEILEVSIPESQSHPALPTPTS